MDDVYQITVLRCENRKDQPKPQSQPRYHTSGNEQTSNPSQGIIGDARRINGEKHQDKNRELNAEPDKVDEHGGKGYYKTRKINLSEKSTILNKRKRGAGKTFGEKRPQNDTGEIK